MSGCLNQQRNTMAKDNTIAVFAKTEFDFNFVFGDATTGLFKHIKTIWDVRGKTFAGVVHMSGWHIDNRNACDAYNALKERQPEIFK